jgi:hypothetical protein
VSQRTVRLFAVGTTQAHGQRHGVNDAVVGTGRADSESAPCKRPRAMRYELIPANARKNVIRSVLGGTSAPSCRSIVTTWPR